MRIEVVMYFQSAMRIQIPDSRVVSTKNDNGAQTDLSEPVDVCSQES
jgi:hypothetical protein